MTFTIEWLPDEPILVVRGSNMLTADAFRQMFAQVNEQVKSISGRVYRIADYSQATSSFMDIMQAVKIASSGAGGTTSDPRIQSIYVGTSQWISLARTALQQPHFGGIQVPTFHTMEDALTYARMQLAQEREKQPA